MKNTKFFSSRYLKPRSFQNNFLLNCTVVCETSTENKTHHLCVILYFLFFRKKICFFNTPTHRINKYHCVDSEPIKPTIGL